MSMPHEGLQVSLQTASKSMRSSYVVFNRPVLSLIGIAIASANLNQ